MDRFTEALKGLIPADQLAEVSKALEEMFSEATAKLEEEYNSKLKEAYEVLEAEKAELIDTRETGYQQAFAIIEDLQRRLELQREEFENHMDEQFEEAWKMIEDEKSKNGNIEVDLYKEFDSKLKDMKEFMVDKVDAFLQLQNAEIYEHAKRNVMNDPMQLERRVAYDKICDIVAGDISSDEHTSLTTRKVEEVLRQLDDLKAHMRILESKNARLKINNDRLTEAVKEREAVITEATKTERKVRAESAKKASGRGNRVVGEQLVTEWQNPATAQPNQEPADDDLLTESEAIKQMLYLSNYGREVEVPKEKTNGKK